MERSDVWWFILQPHTSDRCCVYDCLYRCDNVCVWLRLLYTQNKIKMSAHICKFWKQLSSVITSIENDSNKISWTYFPFFWNTVRARNKQSIFTFPLQQGILIGLTIGLVIIGSALWGKAKDSVDDFLKLYIYVFLQNPFTNSDQFNQMNKIDYLIAHLDCFPSNATLTFFFIWWYIKTYRTSKRSDSYFEL